MFPGIVNSTTSPSNLPAKDTDSCVKSLFCTASDTAVSIVALSSFISALC